MRSLIGQLAPTKKVTFLGKKDSVEIKKLTGLEVKGFQSFVNTEVKTMPEAEQGLAIHSKVIRIGVVDAETMTDDEIDSFPLDEISKLAKEVLSYSGINTEDQKGND
jgi:hypothetical protein